MKTMLIPKLLLYHSLTEQDTSRFAYNDSFRYIIRYIIPVVTD